MRKVIHKLHMYKFHFLLYYCFVFIFACYGCAANENLNLVELGNKYYIEHNYDEAVKFYEEALKKGYRSFDVFHNLGSIYYYEKKNFKKAEEIFKKGLLMYPNDDILHSTLSQLYFDMDNFYEAVKEYKLAVKFVKGRPLTMNTNKARELLELEGKTEKEIYDFFKKIITYNPNDYYAIYEITEYEKNEEKWKQALEKYKRIIELSPNMRNVVVRDMGICYYKLEDRKSALLYLEEAKRIGDYVPEAILDELKK